MGQGGPSIKTIALIAAVIILAALALRKPRKDDWLEYHDPNFIEDANDDDYKDDKSED